MPAEQKNNYVNKLFYGDNLDIMEDKIPDNSIDLIYLDPPFNSNRNYNRIYSTNVGQPVPEEAIAFCDAWELTEEKEEDIKTFYDKLILDDNENFAKFWLSWTEALKYSNSKILSYLVFMALRLRVMRNKLKDTGSLFLHCDATASHYIKILLDGIFGIKNFKNEIIWSYSGNSVPKKFLPRKHDIILWYSKKDKCSFYPIYVDYAESTLKRYNHIDDEGRRYKISALKNGIQEIVYMKEGKPCTDVWNDIPIVRKKSERMGYPTQKPVALLERIIKMCSDENDIIMDPFCGCGTTLDAAQKLNRKWIGIDICMLSVSLIENRLKENYPLVVMKGRDYTVDGIPITIEQVEELIHKSEKSRNEGRYQFQYWAVEKVGGFASTKKSGDGGIDGSIYFYKDEKKTLAKMILSVKSNKKLQASFIRDLIGTMNNNDAEMAGLISYAKPTQEMINECKNAGRFKMKDGLFADYEFDRVQILTAEDILNGKRFDLPYTRILKKS